MLQQIWAIYLGLLLSLATALAGDVGIDLRIEANWAPPPFVLQVIESIAAENSSAYFPLLTAISSHVEASSSGLANDEEVFNICIDHCLEMGFLTQDQVPYVSASLAMTRYSALIQAHYQYFDSWTTANEDRCSNVVVYNNDLTTCDIGAVFALKTKKAKDGIKADLLPFDRVLGVNQQAPLAVLYTDISSEEFATFHAHLSSSALEGKIRYVIRYKPSISSGKLATKEQLAGYGAILNVKRTDYLVIDDGKSEAAIIAEKDEDLEQALQDSSSSSKKKSPYKKLQETTEAAALDKASIPLLGFKTAGHIMDSEEPFQSLINICLNFPKFSKALSESDTGLEVSREVRRNMERSRLLGSGESVLLVNGALTYGSDISNIFDLFNVIDAERDYVSRLAEIGFNKTTARQLIENNLLDGINGGGNLRFDYRGNFDDDEEPLVWINDIEVDRPYQSLSPHVHMYNQDMGSVGALHPVRHNTHSVVFAMGLSDPKALQLFGQSLSFIMRGLPVQLGVIPLGHSPLDKAMARHVFALSQMKNSSERLGRYLSMCLMGHGPDQVFQQVSGGADKEVLNSDYVQTLLRSSEQWAQSFDVKPALQGSDASLVFANGKLVSANNPDEFLLSLVKVFTEDLEEIREYINQDGFDADTMSYSLRDWLIRDAMKQRNSLIMPSDMSREQFVDTAGLWSQFDEIPLPHITSQASSMTDASNARTLWFVANLGSVHDVRQLRELAVFAQESKPVHVRLNIVPLQGTPLLIDKALVRFNDLSSEQQVLLVDDWINVVLGSGTRGVRAEQIYHDMGIDPTDKIVFSSSTFSSVSQLLLEDSNRALVQKGIATIIYMGRALPLRTSDSLLNTEDIISLLAFEEPRVLGVLGSGLMKLHEIFDVGAYRLADTLVATYTKISRGDSFKGPKLDQKAGSVTRVNIDWAGNYTSFEVGDKSKSHIHVTAVINPVSEKGQELVAVLEAVAKMPVSITVYLNPSRLPKDEIPLKRFYRAKYPMMPEFGSTKKSIRFDNMPQSTLFTMALNTPSAWIVMPSKSIYDLDNIILDSVDTGKDLEATYELKHILIEGSALDVTTGKVPRGLALELRNGTHAKSASADTLVMANYGYFQLQANPGQWLLETQNGRSSEIFKMVSSEYIWLTSMTGTVIRAQFQRNKGMDTADVLANDEPLSKNSLFSRFKGLIQQEDQPEKHAEINIFSVASGHLYERFLSIMTDSVMRHTNHTVKFWFIENFLSPSFKEFLPTLAENFGFKYELITYKWPRWLNGQSEKQREIWGYKILFLDVLFPLSLDKVIFVDADQVVRTDLKELVDENLQGAPYGYTPMCDSRKEMEGFRFWKQGFWEQHLAGQPYHISALYVVDINRFRQMAAGDILRKHYQQLSHDPNSLANLDQDLPNYLQSIIPIHSLSQDWLWCETWCSDEALSTAKTIDLCNNPLTKEPKLDRARRQLSEWTGYDNEVANLRTSFENTSLGDNDREQSVNDQVDSGSVDEEYDYHEDL